MSNKLYDIFNPDSDYNKRVKENLERIERQWIEERSCFVCKKCIDISDDRDTCHLCEYTNNLLPEEMTCLLWEKNDKND